MERVAISIRPGGGGGGCGRPLTQITKPKK